MITWLHLSDIKSALSSTNVIELCSTGRKKGGVHRTLVSMLGAHKSKTQADSTGSRVWDGSLHEHRKDFVKGDAYSKSYLALGEL